MEDLETFAKRLRNLYNETRPPENLKIMERYIKKERHSGLKDATIAHNYSTLMRFSEWCTIPLKDLVEDDILDYLDYLEEHTYTRGGATHKYSPESIHTFKICLKKFFNAINRPEIAIMFKDKAKKLEEIDRTDLLTTQDVEAMLQGASNARDRAIIALLFESGCRRGEMLSVRIKDVVFNDFGCMVTFPEGKTGKRSVQLVYAASFIRSWVSMHPGNNIEGTIDPYLKLFVNLHATITADKHLVFKELSEQGLYLQLQKVAKRVGIKKRVNPHSWRHAAATRLSEHMSDAQLKKHLGWTQGSNMTQVYVHDPDTTNAVLRMYGIERSMAHDEELKVSRCPRCKEICPSTALYCSRCGLVLDQAAKERIENDASEADLLLFKIASQNPNFYETLAAEMKRISTEKD